MSLLENPYVAGIGCFALGSVLSYWLLRWRDRSLQASLRLKERTVLESAQREAESLVREARLKGNEEALKIREATERSFAEREQEIGEAEKNLLEREALINLQLKNLVEEEKSLHVQHQDLQRKTESMERGQQELHNLLAQRRAALESVANLTANEARQILLKEVEQETLLDANSLSRRILDDAKARAEEKARRIICLAIQRYAGDHTFESTNATLNLPDGELKGRIIGREGRNIRAFEAATGVTVLIDDTPNAVVLSAFDPVRREIAREAMQRLVLDGRIHPTRIEEVVAKVTEEVDETIMRTGEEAVVRVGLPPLHAEITKVLGKLRFRHSFSQNVLEHSIEVAHLTAIMAAELKLDIASAKRAGLLHDIGKAVNHEVEGAHALVGADFVRRFGESTEVVNAVASHHNDVPHNGPLGILVEAADAISASRPGARSETMATYIKRVEDLEQIGMSFTGVEKCYAVQAGRELRVLVLPEQVNDEQAFALAKNISRKIENELQYPGQIRVTVVRETRCIEFAK